MKSSAKYRLLGFVLSLIGPLFLNAPLQADSPAPSTAKESVSGKSTLDDLRNAVLVAEHDQTDRAWKGFLSARIALLEGSKAVDEADRRAFQPTLSELGKAFYQRGGYEEALDVWMTAALLGDSTASARSSEAIRHDGWPFWLRPASLRSLPVSQERLPEAPFGGAILASEGSATLPLEDDPLYRRHYRYGLAIYEPDAPSSAKNSVKTDDAKDPIWLRLRFVLRYQREKDENLARRLARNFAALYPPLIQKLGRHTRFDANGRINVWLDSEGLAGGEQWKENVYFYDLDRPRSNLEWMRECAHEYGHESLPGSGGFSAPEDYADGELGERLMLRWLKRDGGSAALDALELKASGLDYYLSRYADPLASRFAESGWRDDVSAKKDRAAMEQMIGLALWAEDAHGTAFLRSMLDDADGDGSDNLWSGYRKAEAAALTSPNGTRIAPTSGVLRFLIPKAGRYRVSYLDKSAAPLLLTFGDARGSLAVEPKLAPAGGSSKKIRVLPGTAWSATPGWYQGAGATILLRRLTGTGLTE